MAAIITGAELAAHLGAAADVTLCDLCANAASAAVAVVVDPLDPDDVAAVWTDDVRWLGQVVASDLYARAMAAPGGGYQLDEFVTGNAQVTSQLVSKGYAVIAAHRAIGGMIG